ncbi:MAG TPA: hypothetical protein VJ484_09265, partial [Lysobacter sp.]|nr:hypothetical protein [Lysobacter sp.]
IRDWGRSALSGRYAAAGVAHDLEAAMATVDVEARAAVMTHDWLAPASSTRFLLSKLPHTRHRIGALDSPVLGTRADHFGWMKQPEAVVAALLRP